MQTTRTTRGKRSEPFWPSVVIRKWLNIKPKVYEFSEDEIETETESEDEDAKNTRGDLIFRMARSENEPPMQVSGPQTKVPFSRMQRRKSETLRIQYISRKDVRVMIGTWNTAGRVPTEDLELDEWLCTKEPADLYILGFQEVVPLNAGNVLGAEDSRPIPKWEAIVRKTLNKSSQPKTAYKSYSTPSSPVSRTSTPAETLVDKIGALDLSAGSNQTSVHNGDCARKRDDQKDLIDLKKKFGYININAIDGAKTLNWPEHPLGTLKQTLTSGKKLRRVMSSSPKTGLTWMGEPEVLVSHDLPLNSGGLKRVHHSSGNLGMLWSEQQETCDVLNSLNDASDKFSEEEDSISENVSGKCESDRTGRYSKNRSRYVRIGSKQMVGIYISVWACRRMRRHIDNLAVYPVGVGLMGYMGNKGSVSVSMSLFQTRLCFVCCHLTSGHKEGDQQKRNSDVYDILQRTQFSSVFDADIPQTIPSHDRIFWFGDLNYRLNMSDTEVRELVSMKRWGDLMKYDQLSSELKSGHTFYGWKEGLINFPPTYKYEINTNSYSGENAKEGEKKRSPAWCDRILWLGKGIRQLSYWSSDLHLSDHRPVGSLFVVELEIIDPWKLHRVLKFTNAGLPPGDIFTMK